MITDAPRDLETWGKGSNLWKHGVRVQIQPGMPVFISKLSTNLWMFIPISKNLSYQNPMVRKKQLPNPINSVKPHQVVKALF